MTKVKAAPTEAQVQDNKDSRYTISATLPKEAGACGTYGEHVSGTPLTVQV